MKCYCPALLLSMAAAAAVPLPGQAPQQTLAGGGAKALMEEVMAAYRSAKTLHWESETQSETVADIHRSWSSGREVLARDGANRARYESYHTSGSYIIVSDGKTLWRAAPDTREYIQSPLDAPLLDVKGGGPLAQEAIMRYKFRAGSYDKLTDNLIQAEQLHDERVEVNAQPIDCAVIRADYSLLAGSMRIEAFTRTFWIDKQRKIILREENVSRGNLDPRRPYAEMQTRQSTRYTIASIDRPLPNSLFVYTPPTEYLEVDKLERAFPRPAKALIGKPAPGLSLPALPGGATAKLSDWRGKPVLLDFWASWCTPCRNQMPFIAQLYRDYRNRGLILAGINDDETPEKALEFLASQTYDWPHLFDGKRHEARAAYKVDAIPTLVLIDKEGKVVEFQIGSGPLAEAAIRAALDKLLPGLTR